MFSIADKSNVITLVANSPKVILNPLSWLRLAGLYNIEAPG